MADRLRGAFASVTASEELKTSTKQYLQKQREKRRKMTFAPAVRRWAAAACAMLVLLIGMGGYYGVSQTPVSYISIDVNPSIELVLNRFDKVLSATAYNDDGSLVLETVTVNGLLYTDAVNAIVESDAMKPYLTETAALTFTVASNDGAKAAVLKAGIDSCSGCINHGGQSYAADNSAMQEAHSCGLSLGKYTAYLILSQYDDSVTAEDCKNMTMKEIRDLICEHTEDVAYTGQGNGNHHGYGRGGND